MESASDLEQEWRRENRRIRRRLLGAAVIFVATVLLWRSGDVPPPPEFYDVPTMPDELIVSSDGREVSDIITDYVEEVPLTTDEAESAVVSADEKAPLVAAEESAEEEEEAAAEEEVSTAPEKPVAAAAEKPAAVPAKTLRLQAGVFSKKANLDALEKTLRAAGYSTAVSEQDGAYKLQIVGLVDAVALKVAEKSLSKILQEISGGGKGEKSDKDGDKKSGRAIVVQVGAFSKHQRARDIVKILKEKGFEVWVEPTDRNGVRLLRVRVGAEDDRAKADATRLELVKLGYKTATVIDLL